jgi:hypothetical protein
MKTHIFRCLAAVPLIGLTGQALAEDFDGSAPLICATAEAFDCGPNVDCASDCASDTPETIDLPRFIRLDFAGKRAFTKRQDGEERVAAIASQAVDSGMLILQGVQNAHAWSLLISQTTGAMSLSISGDGVGFVIFGSCTAP